MNAPRRRVVLRELPGEDFQVRRAGKEVNEAQTRNETPKEAGSRPPSASDAGRPRSQQEVDPDGRAVEDEQGAAQKGRRTQAAHRIGIVVSHEAPAEPAARAPKKTAPEGAV